jgi:hypothetical protein
MGNDFLKSGFNLRKSSGRTFLSDKRTVCVKHQDGHVTEHRDITDPWRYIAKVKKNMGVVDAWVKDE